MALRYWCSDYHFGHPNILRYCRRPWLIPDRHLNSAGDWLSPEIRDAVTRRATAALVDKANSRVKPEDTVIHVGDFCMKRARDAAGVVMHARDYEAMLNGHWTFIIGNHDRNNGLRFGFHAATCRVGQYDVYVTHVPVDRVPDGIDFVVCGHVHGAWGVKCINGIIHVNVGVDVRKYAPVSDTELIGIYEHAKRSYNAAGFAGYGLDLPPRAAGYAGDIEIEEGQQEVCGTT